MNNEILKLLQHITFLYIYLNIHLKEKKEEQEEFLNVLPQSIISGYDLCLKKLSKEYPYLPKEMYDFYRGILKFLPEDLSSINNIQSIIYSYLQILNSMNEMYKNIELKNNQGYME